MPPQFLNTGAKSEFCPLRFFSFGKCPRFFSFGKCHTFFTFVIFFTFKVNFQPIFFLTQERETYRIYNSVFYLLRPLSRIETTDMYKDLDCANQFPGDKNCAPPRVEEAPLHFLHTAFSHLGVKISKIPKIHVCYICV